VFFIEITTFSAENPHSYTTDRCTLRSERGLCSRRAKMAADCSCIPTPAIPLGLPPRVDVPPLKFLAEWRVSWGRRLRGVASRKPREQSRNPREKIPTVLLFPATCWNATPPVVIEPTNQEPEVKFRVAVAFWGLSPVYLPG
jgi:hypothetical protein